jgi:DNA invertase Pin-like site-specific DNA recombinase
MKTRPGKSKGEKHYAAKLTQEKVKEIRQKRKEKGIFYRTLAKEYGVSTSTIVKAINHETWYHAHD